MRKLILLFLGALAPALAVAQSGSEPWVIEDRGARLEVMEGLRALPEAQADGRTIAYRIVALPADSPMHARRLGVVFNHALQRQGFLTGEIAFRAGAGGVAGDDLPGLTLLLPPDVYAVTAATPGEFVSLFRRLKARADLGWIEPVVIYGRVRLQ
jgi:hypothetical protein